MVQWLYTYVYVVYDSMDYIEAAKSVITIASKLYHYAKRKIVDHKNILINNKILI